MEPAEIIETAKMIPAGKMGTILLESGEDSGFSGDEIRRVVAEIKSATSLSVALCVGERSLEEYRIFREAGADHILLHQETTNWVLYGMLNQGRKLEERQAALQSIQDVGIPVWTGGLVGPSGQSLQGMAEDIVSYAKMKAELVNVVPFLPSPGEGLGQVPGAGLGLFLKAVAATRVVNPKALMPVCVASTFFHANVWRLMLGVGANVLVADLTPRRYRKDEAASQALLQDGETVEGLVERASKEIHAAGRKLSAIPEIKGDA
jgi:biotin synthase